MDYLDECFSVLYKARRKKYFALFVAPAILNIVSPKSVQTEEIHIPFKVIWKI